MRHLLVGFEGGSVRVQLVEDSLALAAFYRVAGVDQRSGLVGTDARCRLSDEVVEVSFAAGLHCEPDHEGERRGVLGHLLAHLLM